MPFRLLHQSSQVERCVEVVNAVMMMPENMRHTPIFRIPCCPRSLTIICLLRPCPPAQLSEFRRRARAASTGKSDSESVVKNDDNDTIWSITDLVQDPGQPQCRPRDKDNQCKKLHYTPFLDWLTRNFKFKFVFKCRFRQIDHGGRERCARNAFDSGIAL